MRKIQKSIDIKVPVQSVYDFVQQPSNLASIWPSLVSVSNVVAKKGGAHDFDYVFKMLGHQFKGHTTVEEAQPGKLARYRNDGGIPSTFTWTYSGLDGNATRLSVDVEYTIPSSLTAKTSEQIAAKMNERDLETMLANLKDLVEQTVVTTTAPAARPHGSAPPARGEAPG
jgi:uncharacterized protein YndB with AHSA1/START domain